MGWPGVLGLRSGWVPLPLLLPAPNDVCFISLISLPEAQFSLRYPLAIRSMSCRFVLPVLTLLAAPAVSLRGASASATALLPPESVRVMIENRCTDCHDAETKKGSLDLTGLAFDLQNPKAYARWVKVFDRVEAGEMPPKGKAQPEAALRKDFLGQLSASLVKSDAERATADGRSTVRRMNRYEYENTVRDLLKAPWLQIKD